jgi:hypothetical protein
MEYFNIFLILKYIFIFKKHRESQHQIRSQDQNYDALE